MYNDIEINNIINILNALHICHNDAFKVSLFISSYLYECAFGVGKSHLQTGLFEFLLPSEDAK